MIFTRMVQYIVFWSHIGFGIYCTMFFLQPILFIISWWQTYDVVKDFLRPHAYALYCERRTFRVCVRSWQSTTILNHLDFEPIWPLLQSSKCHHQKNQRWIALTVPVGNFETALPPQAVFLRTEEGIILRECLWLFGFWHVRIYRWGYCSFRDTERSN